MRCLTDAEIQAVVDHEAGEEARAHLAACDRCRARADERRADIARLVAATDAAAMPPESQVRIRAAIAAAVAGASTPRRGATALRAPDRPRSWRRAGIATALATAAAVLVVYAVLPHVGAPTTLSASEVLGRSLQAMTATHGVELLEYNLTIGGAAAEQGAYRIEQLVDRDHPARFRLAKYAADGVVQSAIAQDPAAGRRLHLIRIDGRNYLFRFSSADPSAFPPVPEMAQAQVEAVIAMMQATADQKLTVVDGGREYVIQVPPVSPKNDAGILQLHQARAVVDGRDFHVREFDASGALLKQPYTVSFRLLRRAVRDAGSVSPQDFTIDAGADAVVLDAPATVNIVGDVIGTALRQLAAARASRP